MTQTSGVTHVIISIINTVNTLYNVKLHCLFLYDLFCNIKFIDSDYHLLAVDRMKVHI